VLQDSVGGLQVERGGDFVDIATYGENILKVRPRAHAVVAGSHHRDLLISPRLDPRIPASR
jgi:hypothetical protein